jgi:hypothetical protein
MNRIALPLLLAGLGFAQDPQPATRPAPGYDDTPFLPGGRWRVHDRARPRPPVAEPPQSTPIATPMDAIVLFDGKDLTQWKGRRGDAAWKVADGYCEVNGTGDIETKSSFGDCQLHIEWQAPPPKGHSQERGNSGVFLMGRYELQILDSYDNETYADGQAAAIYGQTPPRVNACRPPGEWQSFDILFTAPRFEGDQLVTPALVSALHNGVLVHLQQEILGGTAHRSLPRYQPHGPGPIRLQDHGNPMRFRNIWVVKLQHRPIPFGSSFDVARKDIAQQQLGTLHDCVSIYMLKSKDKEPTMLKFVTPDEKGFVYLETRDRKVPRDPWGNEYECLPGKRPGTWVVRSRGPDGKPDTADDLVSK